MSAGSTAAKGTGFFGTLALLLTGLFVAGKIFGFLSWSWWLVFLPALIYVGIPVVVLSIVLAVGVLVLSVAAIGVVGYILFLLMLTLVKSLKRKLA